MLAEVSHVTDQFILRRTNRLNARFLPPKQIFNVLLGCMVSLYMASLMFFCVGGMEEKLILLGAGKIAYVARQKLAKWEFVCFKKNIMVKWEE